MSCKWCHILAQHIVPQHFFSKLVGMLTHCQWKWVKNFCIQLFIRRYQVDMFEAVTTDPTQYPDFNHFFTRAIKPNLRPITMAANSLASPADGTISQLGNLANGQLLQAKNHYYNAQDLLGGSEDIAQQFLHGSYMTIYLAPKDYHRVHMPVNGRLREMIYVPGKLFSVNPHTAETVKNLFARNERVVALFDTEQGPLAVILVGAMLVASIETVWAGVIAPSRLNTVHSWQYENETINLAQGDELGRFQFGSTVILLTAKQLAWDAKLAPDSNLNMGAALGSYLTR